MTFGQQSGPPASRRQIEELESLLGRAGFSSFREARHPYGLTQRQASGKFTVAEADELLERLNAAELVQSSALPEPAAPATARPTPSARRRRAPGADDVLGSLTDEALVAELERRGWCCIPPLGDR